MASFYTTTYKVYTDLSRNSMIELIGIYSARQIDAFVKVLQVVIHEHYKDDEVYTICFHTAYEEDANIIYRITSALEKGHSVDVFGNITECIPKNDNETLIEDDSMPF